MPSKPDENRPFATDEELATYAAGVIAARLADGFRRHGRMTLGCPSGRSPWATYRALAEHVAAKDLDLSNLHLIMMDEFISPDGSGWSRCSPDAHFSCTRFGEREIRRVLNQGLPAQNHCPPEHLHVPDPNDPDAYEALIDSLGGVDVFILASGASDGHVAFNPPGTVEDAATRVVRLADTTRRDNLSTFPAFEDLSAVPRYGVTVGPGTIARASHSAIMILTGVGKAEALRRIAGTSGYDPAWPSTIVRRCRHAVILADQAAVDAAGLARAPIDQEFS